MATRPLTKTSIVALALIAVAVLVALGWSLSATALATDETEAELTEAQQAIESSSQAYEEAVARGEELQAQIDESEQRIGELRDLIPAQQEKSNDALRELYKMERDSSGWIEMVLSSESFSDLLACFDYIGYIQNQHIDTLNTFIASKNELETTRETLTEARQEAQTEAERAQEALAEAQKARQEAQAKAEREAQAERAAAAQAVATAAGDAATTAAPSDSGSYETVTDGGTVETVTPPSSDNADWGSDKAGFVSSWGSRINNYLAGSPMAGYGEVFASAAWDYGVDPRWSPAIACIESGKGAACFRSHNAWGWGQTSWGSWEDAIYSHVAGLARGYGYTISEAAAKKYCPPNWSSWFNNVSSEMSRI